MTKRRKSASEQDGSAPRPQTARGRPYWGPRARIALLLAGVTVVLGLMAAAVQPFDPNAPGCKQRTPPDETAHVLYVRHLLKERTLPVLTGGGGNYEAHQPPLYYITVAPWMAVGERLGLRPRLVAAAGVPPPEVWFGRVWSVLIAAGVTVACYLLASAVFTDSGLLGLSVGVVCAMLPGHLINLAAITNDGLAELLSTLVLWQSVVLLRRSPPTLGRCLALGLLTGAALLTKTSCLFLLPVIVAAIALSGSRWGLSPLPGWRFALALALAVVPALLLCAPWIAHNLAHYPGDPLVTRTFVGIFAADRATPQTFFAAGMSPLAYVRLVVLWTYLSVWGVFGQTMVFMPGWYYLLGTLLVVACVLGYAKVYPPWSGGTRDGRYHWSLVALPVILVLLQFISFNRTFFQAQARYLFPAIGPLACFFVMGLFMLGDRVGGAIGQGWAQFIAWAVLAIMLLSALVEIASRGPVGLPVWL